MSRPLRIAVFTGCFPVVSETFIARQIAGLLDRGHDVDLFADVRGDPAAPLAPELESYQLLKRTTFMDMPPECAPWELPAWPEEGETWLPGAAEAIPNRDRLARARPLIERCRQRAPQLTAQALDMTSGGYRAASLSALYRLDRLSGLPGNYDILHAHFGPVAESFRFARRLWNAPLVVSFHGYDFTTVPRQQGRNVYAELFREADAVTANSNYTRGQLVALGCPPEKLHLLHVGLDPQRYRFRERAPGNPIRLITVARLVEIKGHEFCLRAVAQLRPQHPNLRYDLVGDGPLRPALEKLVNELDLGDVVRFHGSRSGNELRALLDDAHLFILGSVSVHGDQEGQGVALQEAQACGLPVVATRHGALPEGMLENESGLLVPERDPAAMAGALGELLNNPARWPGLGRAGRRLVESRFDLEKLNDQLAALYQTTVDQFRATHCNQLPNA